MRVTHLIAALLSLSLVGGVAQAKPKKKPAPTQLPPMEEKPKPAEHAGLNSLTLACSTTNADVFVDGEMIGKAPIELPVPVSNGNHTIRVVKLGFAPYVDVFKAVPGKPVKLEVELVPISGVLHIKSSVPKSRVLVDGKYLGDAPVDAEVEVGPRAVQVSRCDPEACFEEYFKNVMAVAGQEENIDVKMVAVADDKNPYIVKPLPPPKWYQKKWVWGVVAAGAVVLAGAATGIALGVNAANADPIEAANQRFTVGALSVP